MPIGPEKLSTTGASTSSPTPTPPPAILYTWVFLQLPLPLLSLRSITMLTEIKFSPPINCIIVLGNPKCYFQLWICNTNESHQYWLHIECETCFWKVLSGESPNDSLTLKINQ